MKKRTKKTLALLLALLLMLSLLPTAVFAEGENAEETPEDPVPGDGAEALPPPADEPEEIFYIIDRYFPDETFRAFVSENYDLNKDEMLSGAELAAVREIRCENLGIRSLAGIELFTALERLDCQNNEIPSLDLSANTGLQQLYCDHNKLSSLDVTENSELIFLECGNNELSELDVSYSKLITLACEENQLQSLDVSGCTQLRFLVCGNNLLTALDVSTCNALEELSCGGNGLSALNLSFNPGLSYLDVHQNRLSSLDVSGSVMLETLLCGDNRLTALDVGACSVLYRLDCSDNWLTELNVAGAAELAVLAAENNQLTELNVSVCPKLLSLYCAANRLESLTLSRNREMTFLSCGGNCLQRLDLSKNTKLIGLYCQNNELRSLDLMRNEELETLCCEGNLIRTLNLTRNAGLAQLYCYDNQILDLDLTSTPILREAALGAGGALPGYPATAVFYGPFTPAYGAQEQYHLGVDKAVRLVTESGAPRIYGKNRFETSLKIARAFQDALNADLLDAVVVANGQNFADALGGSYLAIENSAPILIVDQNHIDEVRSYIQRNVRSGGTVYLLGGEAVVPDSIRNGLEAFRVKRLAGKDRYQTNLEILKEAGVRSGDQILVCSGTGFADSLSASASGYPILLVGNTLSEAQKEYLSDLGGRHEFIMIGGEGAVKPAVEEACRTYGPTSRVGGANRYETSRRVAERFISNPDTVLLAYGQNFPDGLCGAPLAYALGGPLLLVTDSRYAEACAYASEKSVTSILAIGGPSLISDATVWNVLVREG